MRLALMPFATCLALVCVPTVQAALLPAASAPSAAVPHQEAADLQADNGFLGIYADPAGTQRCATVLQGSFGVLYLFADLAGGAAGGITGVEFRIQVTNPGGYQFFYGPPDVPYIMLGNPFDLTPDDPLDQTGANIAFPTCQSGPRVPLGTVVVVNQSGGPTELRVERRNIPTNPLSPCPLFVDCSPPKAWPDGEPGVLYAPFCMRTCASNATGGAIAFRASLNDPACTLEEVCVSDCAGAPCVELVASGPTSACIGSPITFTATATNCAATPEDVELFVNHELAGSFADVQPGQSVSASRTLVLQDCRAETNRFAIGAVARHGACPEPYGAELARNVLCTPGCSDNHNPVCLDGRPSVATLWPPNGQLVPIEILGVTDPDGDPLVFEFIELLSDEPTGTINRRDCPDAVVGADGRLRLRAERAAPGNGRQYHVVYEARDNRGGACGGFVTVCVPMRPGEGCIGDLAVHDATGGCSLRGRRPGARLAVAPRPDAGADLLLSIDADADARIEVFDVRGRVVTTIEPGVLPAGEHRLRWNGRDGGGRAVATGIYVFRMRSGAGEVVAKGVIVR